jgi:hypothetical protein
MISQATVIQCSYGPGPIVCAQIKEISGAAVDMSCTEKERFALLKADLNAA